MLTNKQHRLLTYILDSLQNNGVAPSFEEMKRALGLKSKSGIHRLMNSLEERGYLRRLPNKARAVEVLKMPQDSHEDLETFTATVIEGDFSGVLSGRERPENDNVTQPVELPLYGKIAAGTPIEALRNKSESISIPTSMISAGEHYALTIEGDSMIEAGILDGDTVVIEQCDTAENGAIVVALIDKDEATLKRLRRKGESIALEPANKHYETRIFGPDRVQVQGKLVGLVRNY